MISTAFGETYRILQWKRLALHLATRSSRVCAVEAQGLDLVAALFIDLETEGTRPAV